MRKFLYIWLLIIVSCVLPTESHALAAKRTVLPNGLTVLHSENHSLPIVMVTLIIKSGQIDEPANKSGLANLIAELLTEGTKNRPSKTIAEEIDFIGASLDASAGNDFSTIALSVLKKDVHKGFELLSDVVLNPAFPQDEIGRKKEQIKGSLKQKEEEPSFLAGRAFRKAIFGDHPYGRVLEGSPETIGNVNREDLVKFHADYFLPSNAILSVAGDLAPNEVDDLIGRYFGEWKMSGLPPKIPTPPGEEKIKKVIKIHKDLTQANIVLGLSGISRDNPDYYVASVMNYILGGGGFSSRLMHAIRDRMGLAYDVHSFFAAYEKAGIFQVGVQTKNESANVVVEEILKQLEMIRKETVSDEELADAKAYLTGSFSRRLDTNRKIADFMAVVEFFNLGIDYAEKYRGYVNSVSKDDVLRVAKKYLDPEKLVIVIVANQTKVQLKSQDFPE